MPLIRFLTSSNRWIQLNAPIKFRKYTKHKKKTQAPYYIKCMPIYVYSPMLLCDSDCSSASLCSATAMASVITFNALDAATGIGSRIGGTASGTTRVSTISTTKSQLQMGHTMTGKVQRRKAISNDVHSRFKNATKTHPNSLSSVSGSWFRARNSPHTWGTGTSSGSSRTTVVARECCANTVRVVGTIPVRRDRRDPVCRAWRCRIVGGARRLWCVHNFRGFGRSIWWWFCGESSRDLHKLAGPSNNLLSLPSG